MSDDIKHTNLTVEGGLYSRDGDVPKPARRLIKMLRDLADHIEANGPDVYISGRANFAKDRPINHLRDRHGEFAVVGDLTHHIEIDMRLKPQVSFAPVGGLRPVRDDLGDLFVWDGKPPRPPRKWEYYLVAQGPNCVARSNTGRRKKPYHIMLPIMPGELL